MLNKEEMKAFLALLVAFSVANALSGNSMAALFGISVPTMARWLRMGRSSDDPTSMAYRYHADPILAKLETLNTMNENHKIYQLLSGKSSVTKVEMMTAALEGRLVW